MTQPDVSYNPRYAAYAKVHGRTPDAQLAFDKTAWPGGCMTGFILWNRERLVQASKEIPEAFFMGQISDHAAYDRWLTALAKRSAENRAASIAVMASEPDNGDRII